MERCGYVVYKWFLFAAERTGNSVKVKEQLYIIYSYITYKSSFSGKILILVQVDMYSAEIQ